MASFFADRISFTSWLNSKTESELKTMLTRADPRARLNGCKSVLVRRVVETTGSLGREGELRVFPELRRRRQVDQSGRVPTGQSRGGTNRPIGGRPSSAGIAERNREEDGPSALPRSAVATRIPRVASEVHIIPRGATVSRVQRVGQVAANPRPQAEVRVIPRPRTEDRTSQVTQFGGARTRVHPLPPSSSNRPLPYFGPTTGSTVVAVPEAPVSTPLRPGFQNPRSFISDLAGNSTVRTPEQVLQERLEVHAGLIIQSITNSLSPRNRRHSMSMVGAAAAVGSSRSRAASTSSAEKMGPPVSVGEEESYKSMLECKICFDDAVNTVLLPCGHACCCKDCSVRLKFGTWDSKCPICRSKIQNISMLYFS